MIRTFESQSDESIEGKIEAPPFGHLPIEIYLVENWDSGFVNSDEVQRKELVKKFLSLGPRRRAAYSDRSISPTALQTSRILEPFRPARLRAAATVMQRGCWLRIDYSNDKKSFSILEAALADIDVEDSDGIILDEKELFEAPGVANAEGNGATCWEKVLEVLPEIVTNSDEDCMHDGVAEGKQEWRDGNTSHLNESELSELEWNVQVYALASMILVEDALTHADIEGTDLVGDEEDRTDSEAEEGTVFQLMLDSYGNVVRSARADTEVVGLYQCWEMAILATVACVEDGDVGVNYRRGGKCAPPYIDISDE